MSAAARGAEQSDSKTTAGAVETRSTADVTGRLARYMVAARDQDLPAPIVRDGKNRILDTIGAMISGAVLPPGVMADALRSRAGRNGRGVCPHDRHSHDSRQRRARERDVRARGRDRRLRAGDQGASRAAPSFQPHSRWQNVRAVRARN